MAHHDTPSRLEITTHAILPLALMLFIQMWLNHFYAPANAIFISPYALAFLVTCSIGLIVLLKGDICLGQRGRLTAILPWLAFFGIGNVLYSIATPKHIPIWIANVACFIVPFLCWKLPEDEVLQRVIIRIGLAICGIGMIAYLLVYWIELPSLLNWGRGNNFAQLLFGFLLAGWYLVLAKSRLEALLKFLVKLGLITLSLNYIWGIFMLYLYQELSLASLLPFIGFFIVQFIILLLLGYLLVAQRGKQIKNMMVWSMATCLAMLYPFTNLI